MALESKNRIQGILQTVGLGVLPLLWTLPDGSQVNDLPVPVNSLADLRLTIRGVNPSNGSASVWDVRAALTRGAAALVVLGIPDIVVFQNAGALGWGIGFFPTNGDFQIRVNGAVGITVEWRGELEYSVFQP